MDPLAAIKKRLNDDLAALDRELRIELPKEIKKALEMGDLRENAEYKAALERQEYVRLRIGQLHKRLSEVLMINPKQVPKDRAAYGSTLHLFDIEAGEEIIYKLVMAEEADPDKGWITTSSPIGKSLMGRKEGDEVKIRTPGGQKHYEISKLITLHDEAP
ncbi:GreA/GreB family elongation factor [Acidobacteriota bacterium]